MSDLENTVIPENALERIEELGFWFVDIPRTSSTSIKSVLSRQYGEIFGKKGHAQGVMPGMIRDHTPARVLRNELGAEIWDRLFVFTVVRNPWDRIYSLYLYKKNLSDQPIEMGFEDFVKDIVYRSNTRTGFHGLYFGSLDYLTDSKGEIIVNHICKFENRRTDLLEVAERLGLPRLLASSRRISGTGHQHYSRYYSEEARALIEKLYAKEIEYFGYVF